MTRRRLIALLAALLILGISAAPDAIAQQAAVEGHARAEEDGAPVPFALVRLVRADSSPLPSDSPPQGITNVDGRYRFDGVFTRDYPHVSDPKWALRNAARNRAQRLSRGYYGPNDGWNHPSELDVLHEDFLKAHCLNSAAERGDGEVGLRFRPLRTRHGFLDVLGTIWLDSATYLARRIDLEYVDGEESRGTLRLDFGDIGVAGGTLRMPVGATFTLRPSRKNPAKRNEGKLTFTYWAFEEVRPR